MAQPDFLEVSRVFGSRFKIASSKYNARNRPTVQKQNATSGEVAGYQPSYHFYGLPDGYRAFYANYHDGHGLQMYVAVNVYASQNSLTAYVPWTGTGVWWNDENWSRVPFSIYWYDESPGFQQPNLVCAKAFGSGSAAASQDPSLQYPSTYRMYVSWLQRVKIQNNSRHDVTAYYREFSGHSFSSVDGSFGSIAMTTWASKVLPAEEASYIDGFQPLEIKFDNTSTEGDILGITDQVGDKTLILM